MITQKRQVTNALLFVVFSGGCFANVALANDEPRSEEQAYSEPIAVGSSEFVLPSFSATHVSLHEPSGQEIQSSAIDLSRKGIRVRELGAGASSEMLQDFVGERAWFIDHDRSVSHELSMIEMPELADASPGATASFLGPKPCGLLVVEDQGPGRWRGRQVTAFHCTDDSGRVLAVEFLDDAYRIVVYRRTVDGFVDELRNLTDRSFNDLHFGPPENYRAVEKQEFFFGAPPLQTYTPDTGRPGRPDGKNHSD